MKFNFLVLVATCLLSGSLAAQSDKFELIDVFDLEYISDPQISADGQRIAYVRNFKDIMTDGNRSNIWLINADGSNNRPLTTGNQNDYAPRWSPDGTRLLYLSAQDGKTQLYLRWLDSSAEQKLTNLTQSPGNIHWSPDGSRIAFSMAVDVTPPTLAKLPKAPQGAKWTTPPTYVDRLNYKADGAGFLPHSFQQLFVISAQGGHPRRLTEGEFNHGGSFSWTPDGQQLIFAANRHDDGQYEPANTEIFELDIATGNLRQLTDRVGPDNAPRVSPNGQQIAYVGYDDRYQGYQLPRIYIMNRDGSNPRMISGDLDRRPGNLEWSRDGQHLYFQYDDRGDTKIARINISNGRVEDLISRVGGLSLGRPYAGGAYSVAQNGRIAFTMTAPDHPADLAVGMNDAGVKRLTQVNADLFDYKQLGEVEEIWYESSYDGRRIQGWICKPPGFDPGQRYPLILEIHGGPFANYGRRFSSEVQLYAAQGYVVLYTNPRGSSGYGEEFGNLIHHNYPSQDYDDLISGVDAVIERGYVDPERLFVTGGSGGGVLTAWIVGKTDRFRAAVVAKPVINWSSFVLHADGPAFFSRYWFPGFPWEEPEHYWQRSPLSLVGNVTTPTMLLTGEQDYRTPMSETEQYYTALKLQRVETAMVRIQDAGHGIAAKPSNLISKVAYILAWFEKYDQE